jgi:hypothetical protein
MKSMQYKVESPPRLARRTFAKARYLRWTDQLAAFCFVPVLAAQYCKKKEAGLRLQ